MANKIKKGDRVMVLAGNDKGKSGEVIKVITGENNKPSKLIISGINLHKKIIKTEVEPGMPAEKTRVDREYSVDVSNVALMDSDGSFGKIGFKMESESSKKVRYFKKSGKVLAS